MTNNDAYAALRIKDYRWFIIARVTLTFAIQIQSVIVGWQVYELTHDALSLGMIGLAEAVPYLCIALFAGHAADVINRKKIIQLAGSIYFLCAILLFLISTELHHVLLGFGVWPIFAIIFITGLARGFISPALLPLNLYQNICSVTPQHGIVCYGRQQLLQVRHSAA